MVLHHYTRTINEVLCEVGVILREEKKPDQKYSYITDPRSEEIFKWLVKKTKGSWKALNYLKNHQIKEGIINIIPIK